MSTHSQSNKVRITKSDLSLRNKTGPGEIQPEKIRQSQKLIEQNNVEFKPIAKLSLEQLASAILFCDDNILMPSEDLLSRLERPVMNLKANGALFGYPLVSDISADMLRFIETRSVVDHDLLKIVQLYMESQYVLINQKALSPGARLGQELRKELGSACKRYVSKFEGRP